MIIKEHWAQAASQTPTSICNSQLKQHGIQKIVLVGVIANSCIESTGRYGMELDYHVILVKDATAAFSPEGMRAAEAGPAARGLPHGGLKLNARRLLRSA